MSFDELDLLTAEKERFYKFLSDDIAKLKNILDRYNSTKGFYYLSSKDFFEKYSPTELAEICEQLEPVLDLIVFDWGRMQKREQAVNELKGNKNQQEQRD